MVVVSPRAQPSATSRRGRRMILPLRYTLSEHRDEPIPLFCRRT